MIIEVNHLCLMRIGRKLLSQVIIMREINLIRVLLESLDWLSLQLISIIIMHYKEENNLQNKQQYNIKQDMMLNRFKATMLLAAVGDSIGYRQGRWQFNRDGFAIHQQLLKITDGKGISKLVVNINNFPFSDDTVMHIATAKGLLSVKQQESSDSLLASIAKYYKKCMNFMGGRAPGNTCIRSARKLNQKGTNWDIVPFQKNGGGCGASMRSACIGLLYSNNLPKLIEISIQSGRITHHNPLGYLGSMTSAYFTSLAIQNIHPYLWFKKLMNQGYKLSQEFISKGRQSEQNLGGDWKHFWQCWINYGKSRNLSVNQQEDEKSVQPYFPQKYGVKQRQIAYKQLSVNGWPGALGIDSVIIAYDALISSISYHTNNPQSNKWQQVCLRGMLHGGDSDSTGTIAAAWYGAYYGFEGVYPENMQNCQGIKLHSRWQQINKPQELK